MTGRTATKGLLDRVWAVGRRRPSSRIIYYHSVHPSDAGSHRPDQFRRQLAWLRDQRYQACTLNQLPPAGTVGRTVAICFDDGYRDNLEVAAPILQEFDYTATVFVVTSLTRDDQPACSNTGYRLYSDRPMLTSGNLAALAAQGIEIGSHAHRHRLAAPIARHSPDQYLADLKLSRDLIGRATGTPPTSFAYPNGQRGAFSATTTRLVAEAGFTRGLTTVWGRLDQADDQLLLPRCEMACHDSQEDFEAKMTGGADWRRITHRVTTGSLRW